MKIAPGVATRINAAIWGEMLDGVLVLATPGETFTPPPGREMQSTSSVENKAELMPAASPRLLSLALDGDAPAP